MRFHGHFLVLKGENAYLMLVLQMVYACLDDSGEGEGTPLVTGKFVEMMNGRLGREGKYPNFPAQFTPFIFV